MRRNWIKLYVDQCLRGTMITELSAAERWIWVGLLLMAGDSNEEGLIFLRKNEKGGLIGYSEPTISELLGVDPSDFHNATSKMMEYEKIEINENKVIKILNWNKYQSEYHRQKKYRGGYKEESNLNCNESNTLEEDRDLDLDRDRDLKEDKKILTLLSKVKNYPFNEEKDLEFIKALKAEFPNVDILEKAKQVCANWLDRPLLKKSRPRVQIRRWVTNEHKWQQEGDKERKVGKLQTRDPKSFDLSDFLPMKTISEIYQILNIKGEGSQEFYNKARLAYPKIKVLWEQSDKKPETFIRLVEACDN